MTIKKLIIIYLAVVVVAGYVLWPKQRWSSPASGNLTVTGILADADTAGFTRAISPRQFRFPEDHGPHLDFKTEWWYYTGNLVSAGGEQFGFQLTFFRSSLAPGDRFNETGPGHKQRLPVSGWRADHIYMAHFGLTDVAGRKFYNFERFSRAAQGLAGASVYPGQLLEPAYRVWLDDWKVSASQPIAPRTKPGVWLKAADEQVALALFLASRKAPVLQGENGLSQKGEASGNASYYYSMTRLVTEGTVTLPDRKIEVTGSAWLDREWSTSALERDQVGWDWFALQLSDTTEIMYYQLRRRDGTADPHSRGSTVDQLGEKETLYPAGVTLDVLATWDSPRGGTYPSQWRLSIARKRLVLTITPLLAGQELDVSFRYWEGAVGVTGIRGGQPIRGVGYVELTGYAE